MDGQAHRTDGERRDAGEYLVVVVDRTGRFRDAYGPYGLTAGLFVEGYGIGPTDSL